MITVLYEDDQFIVFDKPSGLLVIPTPKNESQTLFSLVNRSVGSGRQKEKYRPCHRLDRDTSGVILFAKGKQNQKLMMDLFRRRQVTKKYIALVHGRLSQKSGEFRRPIRDLHQKQFRKNSPALQAITKYHVLEAKKGYSVIEVQPVTGRTNQIRIHFTQAAHPLLGERKYAFARDYPLKFRRTALHAASLAWRQPVTGMAICVKSGLPEDMSAFIKNN